MLSKLVAPEGVFSVLGNHDHWGDTERSLYWLEKSGQNARSKAIPIERKGQRLWVVGVGDLWEDDIDLDEVLREVPKDECRIVLAHNPDSADSPYEGDVDLMISGHTHGGQINVPFFGPPVLPVKNKSYSSGLVRTTKGQSTIHLTWNWMGNIPCKVQLLSRNTNIRTNSCIKRRADKL